MEDGKKQKNRNKKPYLSIIIPTLNEEDYIGLLLEDLINQTFTDFEVIVSDSSSDDKTLDVAKSFKGRLQLSTVVVEKKSAGHGRNGGAKKAKGEFFFFLDADSRLPRDYVEVVVKEQERTSADFMTTHFRAAGWNPVDRLVYWADTMSFKYKHFRSGKPIMTGCSQFMRAEVFATLKGYNPEMKVGEDIDFSRRLHATEYTGHFVSKTRLVTSNRRFKKDGRLKMILRHIYWITGWKWLVGGEDKTDFGHYAKNKSVRFTKWLVCMAIVTLGIILIIGSLYEAEGDQSFGVSFSTKYAEELGLDWQKTLEKSAGELPIEHYRIMSYWDRVEPQEGEFSFDEIDTQLRILDEEGKTATLVIGLRQPRWPECHEPSWYGNLSEQEKQIKELDYIEAVVRRYRFNTTVHSWQLENEAANRNFGECPDFDKDFYTTKYNLLRSLSAKPIIINISNQSGWPLQGPAGDKTGFSIYKEAYFEAFGKNWSWKFWYIPSWWHGFRAQIVEWQHGTESFVHELQTEPWAPESIKNYSESDLRKYFTAEELEKNIEFAKQTGMKEIWLWGVEFWYWHEQEFGDSSYLKKVTEAVSVD